MLDQARQRWHQGRGGRFRDRGERGFELIDSGRYQAGLRHIQAAESAAQAAGRLRDAVELLVAAADILLSRQQLGLASWCASEAMLRSAEAGDFASRVAALDVRGDVDYASGDADAAVTCWRLALEAAKQTGDAQQILDAHEALGLGLQARGEFDSAAEHFQAALNLAATDRGRETDQIANLGYLAAARGDRIQAGRGLNEALQRYLDDGDQTGIELVTEELRTLDSADQA